MADDQFHASINGFKNGVSGKGRRHIDDRSISAGMGNALLDRVIDGPVEMAFPATSGRDAANDLRAIGNGLFGVEGAGLAGETLNQRPWCRD